ncbi:MAG: divalent-cation tolerance protein CutA [Hydrogenothermaceae bacterium]|nr:divalent-cation tolerance protein CutA [Hydrogenothermaceae bacterium]
MDYIMVFITVPTKEDALKISDYIVERSLGACVNVVELVQSTFFWKGNIEREKEFLLIVKTNREKFEDLKISVKSIHPYTVPEIVAVPIVIGNEDYLVWIDDTLNRG